MPAADEAVTAVEAKALLDPFAEASTLVLAVSGGADLTALLVLAARWRRGANADRGCSRSRSIIDCGASPQLRRVR